MTSFVYSRQNQSIGIVTSPHPRTCYVIETEHPDCISCTARSAPPHPLNLQVTHLTSPRVTGCSPSCCPVLPTPHAAQIIVARGLLSGFVSCCRISSSAILSATHVNPCRPCLEPVWAVPPRLAMGTAALPPTKDRSLISFISNQGSRSWVAGSAMASLYPRQQGFRIN